jgi:hypothetical protein
VAASVAVERPFHWPKAGTAPLAIVSMLAVDALPVLSTPAGLAWPGGGPKKGAPPAALAVPHWKPQQHDPRAGVMSAVPRAELGAGQREVAVGGWG